jgi:hypothetical protein
MARFRHLISSKLPVASMAVALSFLNIASASTTVGAAPETGLKFWLWEDQGMLLELKQRLPDQTRGFFEARGFDQVSANKAGTACIFQTMLRNTGSADSGRVNADLSQWQVVSSNRKTPMLLREDWNRIWKESPIQLAEPSRLAFEWSLLPTKQEFDPGDYNWGMTSYGLPPGSSFDLELNWLRDGKQHHGRIENIECPDDIHPDPPSDL